MPRSLTVTVLALALALVTVAGCAGSDKTTWGAPLESGSPMYIAVSPSTAVSLETLHTVRVCCDALSALHYQPLNTKDSE